MPDQTQPFYVTTPIYYVNARPHIGHAYSTIVADVLARRHRLLGQDVYFLTGTDEHGQKIERSAAAARIPPQQFADQVSKTFSDLWARMGITHNQFIRTTDPKHIQGVQKLFADLHARGQIYLSSYTGQYSVGEEMFVEGPPGTLGPDGRPTETVTEENFFFRLSDYQLPLLNLIESNELIITPDSSRNEVLKFLRGNTSVDPSEWPEIWVTDSDGNYRYTDESLKEQTQVRLESGRFARSASGALYQPGALRDLSVSRSSFTWGIPVPKDIQQAAGAKEKHVIYVWLDALANYMNALGYGSPDDALWQKFWPADIHLVGKEITRFHCVYWPAFLLAAGLPLPKQVTANGWLLFDNSKMSKSKGNVVRTETILDAFGTLCPPPNITNTNALISTEAKRSGETPVFGSPQPPPESTDRRGTASAVPLDPTGNAALAAEVRLASPQDRDLFAADILRYYLLREIPFGQDGSFSFDSLITRYNADLANGYGNLVKRTLNMINLYLNGQASSQALADYDRMIMVRREGQDPLTISIGTGQIAAEMLAYHEGEAEKKDERIHRSLIARENIVTAISDALSEAEFEKALEHTTAFIQVIDEYLTSKAPWKLSKSENPEDRKVLEDTLYVAEESIRQITALLYPILPYATARVWAQLGLGDIEQAAADGDLRNLKWGDLQPGTKLGPLSPIFPRADKGLAQLMTDMENPPATSNQQPTTQTPRPESPLKSATTPAPAAPIPASTFDPAAPPRTASLDGPTGTLTVAGSTATTTHSGPTPSHTEMPGSGIFARPPVPAPTTPSEITIDDFAKIDLRVAQIVLCERIPKADKLLRLEVDLGPLGRRQILSGIAEFYTPEELTGRRIVVIANLAPRKMRGLQSHGMLLAASDPEAGDHGKPALATCGDDIPLGSRLK